MINDYKQEYSRLKNEIKNVLIEEIDFTKELEERELLELIDEKIRILSLKQRIPLEDRTKLRKEVFRALRQLDVLQELIEDPQITEIMINGTEHIFLEREGKLIEWDNTFESEEKLNDIIQQIVSACNRVVNEASPIVDARLQNGSRVNVVLKPIALNGPIVTIRRFPEKPIDMKRLIELGALDEETNQFLKKLVLAGYNILISGGTGSGKTTFLNALSNYIPNDQRVITIEDSAELQLMGLQNLVRLETRNANTEGCLAITIRDLIKSALRMRPDRIVVGEVRGAEAIDLLQALACENGCLELENIFNKMRNAIAMSGYMDNNMGSFYETLKNMGLGYKYRKFNHNYQLNDIDRFRYGLPISEEFRKKIKIIIKYN